MTIPWPIELRIRRADRTLEVDFDSGDQFTISASLLRAMTPSAAERGHGSSSQDPLPVDFSDVGLITATPVGAYAVRLVFDDGHDSGLYTWATLHTIGRDQDRLKAQHSIMLARP